ncbi:MAG: DUF1963 domain-containing protein [Phycisphaerales bacterium]|nr:DUF1963 domain-containing protein [Phycisphaerales bacterium]
MNLDEMKSKFVEAGFERFVEGVSATAEHCLRLVPSEPSGEPLACGVSKFGGCPDLSDDFVWPVKGGRQLFFLAQFNMNDIPALTRESKGLPASGLLSFWYDCSAGPWGFDPKDAGAWQIHFVDLPNASLSNRDFPEFHIGDLDEDPQYPWGPFNECAVQVVEDCNYNFYIIESMMESVDAEIGAVEADELWNRYEKFIDEELLDEEGNHQMFGVADQVQGEMDWECQLVSNGIYLGDTQSDSEQARIKSLLPGVQDWKLLLQLDTDSNGPDWMWGDCGKLYFWMREQDLKSHEFSKCWGVLQCY